MSHVSSVQERSGGMCWYKKTRNVVVCLGLTCQVFMTGELVLLCPSINGCGIAVKGLFQCSCMSRGTEGKCLHRNLEDGVI